MEPNIWIRSLGDYFECFRVCVDNLNAVTKNPKKINYLLINEFEFKLKGIHSISCYLGFDSIRYSEGALYFLLKKCFEKVIDSYVNNFGCKTKLN